MDEKIAERIASWILKGGIQFQDGPECGAAAGWLPQNGEPAFAYTEITGYFLTCMAFMRASGRREPEVESNARRAAAWLHKKCRGGITPRTRYYLPREAADWRGASDWRNDAIFSFDLAMVLRGLGSVKRLVPERSRRETVEVLARQAGRFFDADRRLMPFISTGGNGIPERWSTRPGPYQLKAAAALLLSGALNDAEAEKAALDVYYQWRHTSPSPLRPDHLHGALYAVEGLILFGTYGCKDAWGEAAEGFRQIVGDLVYERSDVVAQVLRAGCALRRRGFLQSQCSNRKLRFLAEVLERFVEKNGAVRFCRGAPPAPLHRNACSAMFAYQAFTYYERFRQENS